MLFIIPTPFYEPFGTNFHPQFVPTNFIAFEQPAPRLLLRCSRLEIISIFSFQALARFILKNIIIDHHIESEPILPKFVIRYASLISKYKVSVL
ncbi:MAG: hypothetical protein LUQ44_07120, partial [Methanothrix sp.]|nr:hypothetical protein [Methanothrix sp.]